MGKYTAALSTIWGFLEGEQSRDEWLVNDDAVPNIQDL